MIYIFTNRTEPKIFLYKQGEYSPGNFSERPELFCLTLDGAERMSTVNDYGDDVLETMQQGMPWVSTDAEDAAKILRYCEIYDNLEYLSGRIEDIWSAVYTDACRGAATADDWDRAAKTAYSINEKIDAAEKELDGIFPSPIVAFAAAFNYIFANK